jgi:hypothetical protein
MKDSAQITILLFCIIITSILSISIYVKGHDNSCDKCEIDFVTNEQSGVKLDNPFVNKIKAVDLYYGLLNSECIIKWDRVQGYYG